MYIVCLTEEICCWQDSSGVKDTSPPFWFEALFHIGFRHDVRRVLSSQRSTCSRTFTFDLEMRPLGSFMTTVLQEATSQLPPETPIEDVTVPEDAGFQILTDVLDQNFGRRHGKVVRCMGKARLRETGASSSRSNTTEVDSLNEEVITLKGQLEVQGEQMRAQGEQMKEQIRAQGEQLHTYAGQMRDLIRAIQMTGLQISLPIPDLAPPSTSEPLHPTDTQ